MYNTECMFILSGQGNSELACVIVTLKAEKGTRNSRLVSSTLDFNLFSCIFLYCEMACGNLSDIKSYIGDTLKVVVKANNTEFLDNIYVLISKIRSKNLLSQN